MLASIPIEEVCRRLKPLYGDKIDQIYTKYTLSTNTEERKEIEQVLNAMYYKKLNSLLNDQLVVLQPPPMESVKGDYEVGTVYYSNTKLYPFSLRDHDWSRHVFITGMSGSGKTNLAYKILKGFIKQGKPFLVFDWKKSFRALLKEDDEMLCFTIGNPNIANYFKINLNRPPKGVAPKEWLTFLCDLITESFSASFGVHKILSETLDKAFRDFKVYEGSENYPTWYQIKDRLMEKAEDLGRTKSRESEWVTSALRIAHALTFGEFGEVINKKEKPVLTIEDLLNKRVIFELSSLGVSEKKFFSELILGYIYKYKKNNYQNYKNSSFEHAILVDEAHHIFLKQKPVFVPETVTEVIYREIREYGTSLICLDQHISKLSEVVAGNSACNIAFQQMLPADIDTISNLMQIRDKKQYFSMLPVGTAIVKLAERYFRPFLIKTDKMDIVPIPDDFIRKRTLVLIESFKRTKQFEQGVDLKSLTEEVKRINYVMYQSSTKTDDVESELYDVMRRIVNYKNSNLNPKSSLSLQQKEFIKFVRKYPTWGTAKVYKALGLSARKGNQIKQELLRKGIIKEQVIVDKKGWKKVMEISLENPESVEGLTI